MPDYRCGQCNKTYNVYSGTVFAGRRLKPEQVILLVHGVVKGEQAQILANETGVCRQTVQRIRQQLQANAQRLQPEASLETNEQTETDEMYQNAGKKSEPHLNPADRHAVGPISGVAMALMKMTVHRSGSPHHTHISISHKREDECDLLSLIAVCGFYTPKSFPRRVDFGLSAQA